MKFINITLSIFALLLLGSCELEKFPHDSLSKDDFNTLQGVNLLSTGIYSNLSAETAPLILSYNIHSSDNFAKLTRNANLEPGSFTTNQISLLDNGKVSWDLWKNCYKNIRTCNNVIAENVFSEDSEMNAAVAEFYFLRAYNYYLLSTFYTRPFTQKSISDLGLPLRLDPKDNSEAQRSNLDELYNQMISDLEVAIANMNKVVDRTKASKEAAQALLARIYNSMLDAESLNETIAEKAIMNANAVLASKNVNLETKSQKFFGSSSVEQNNWPSGTEHYYASAAKSQETIWLLIRNSVESLTRTLDVDINQSNSGSYLPISNDYSSLLNKYSNDLRNNLIDKSYDTNGDIAYASSAYQSLATNCNKYSFQDGVKNLGSMVILRATEMNLILAEVYAKKGDITKTLEYLNPIRKRAGVNEYTETDWTSNNYGITNLLDLVLNEKRLEMVGENLRKSDVYRNKKNIVRKYQFDSDSYLEAYQGGTISRWDANEIIIPIPYGQILQSPNMIQNPY